VTTKLTEKNISSVTNTGVSWQSVIIADGSTGTTGVSGRGYFINTTSAAHTFTLPATATFGDSILIKDYAGTFATNNLTIARNGHNIQGVANNSLITTNRASVVLVYVDVTRGWEFVAESNVADLQQALFITATGGTITTDGDFKVHSFIGDGCFVVSTVGNPVGSDSVDYLVVAGGGGGGGGGGPVNGKGAGGGAGGYRTSFPGGTKITTTVTTYPVTVGAGGAGGPGNPNGATAAGSIGSNSIFSTITSAGGGGGAGTGGNPSPGGGSGGGGGPLTGPAPFNANPGPGNSPPVSPPQGNAGGTGAPGVSGGAGGGGAGAVGTNAPTGTGGAGVANSITGSPITYSTGGAGNVPAAGTDNTGNGGGGGGGPANNQAGATGGKGIVIIRYKFQ